MEVFVHVGLHKCASSYVQSLFFSNADKLRGMGLFYPAPEGIHGWEYESRLHIKFGGGAGNHSLPLFSAFCENPSEYHGVTLNSLDGDSYRKAVRESLSEMLSMDKAGYKQIFFSGEELTHPSFGSQAPRDLISFLQMRECCVKILFLIRDPLPLVSSLIQQKVKGGWVLKKCIKTYPDLYQRRIQHWLNAADELGAELSFVNIDSERSNDSLASLEARILGLVIPHNHGEFVLSRDSIRPNSSLTQSQVHILSRINMMTKKHNMLPFEAYRMRQRALKIFRKLFKDEKFAMLPSWINMFSKELQHDVDWLNSELFRRGFDNEIVALNQQRCVTPPDFVVSQHTLNDIAKLVFNNCKD